MTKNILVGIIFALAVALAAWCAGFDFDERGRYAFCVYIFSLLFFCVGFATPKRL